MVTVTPAAGAMPVTMQYTTVAGTATGAPAGTTLSAAEQPGTEHDYITRAGTLTFTSGESAQTIRVVIVDDSHVEADEAFTVQLSALSANAGFGGGGSTLGADVTITSADQPVVGFDENDAMLRSVAEGETIRFPVTVSPTPLVDLTVPVTVAITPAGFRPAGTPESVTSELVFAAGDGMHGSSAMAVLTIATAVDPGTGQRAR